MEAVTIIMGVLSLLGYLSKVTSLDEWKRILEGEVEYSIARMLDIEGEISSTPIQRSKKQKRDHALRCWTADGQKSVEKAQCLLRDVGSWRCYLLSVKMRWDAFQLVSALRLHAKKGDELLEKALSEARGLCSAYHVPVKHMAGQETSKKLDELKFLLGSNKVVRIAIHGIDGIGKTFLLKHLHNWALDKFDCVVWVSCPDQFTIKNVQDAVAARVNCDISNDIDLNVRALKLSRLLVSRGRFALFLDGVPEADVSLDDIGIPTPAECSEFKLVLSTDSSMVVKKLHSLVTVNIEPLPGEEAYQLFLQEARIGPGLVSSLDEIPRLLADTCGGIPSKIVNLGACMSGKDDPREWSYELFQSGCLRKNKRPLNLKPLRRSKRLKKSAVPSPFTLGEGETSSSAHRPG